jgi:hypothetical protein
MVSILPIVSSTVSAILDPYKVGFCGGGGELETVNRTAELSEVIKKFVDVVV